MDPPNPHCPRADGPMSGRLSSMSPKTIAGLLLRMYPAGRLTGRQADYDRPAGRPTDQNHVGPTWIHVGPMLVQHRAGTARIRGGKKRCKMELGIFL